MHSSWNKMKSLYNAIWAKSVKQRFPVSQPKFLTFVYTVHLTICTMRPRSFVDCGAAVTHFGLYTSVLLPPPCLKGRDWKLAFARSELTVALSVSCSFLLYLQLQLLLHITIGEIRWNLLPVLPNFISAPPPKKKIHVMTDNLASKATSITITVKNCNYSLLKILTIINVCYVCNGGLGLGLGLGSSLPAKILILYL